MVEPNRSFFMCNATGNMVDSNESLFQCNATANRTESKSTRYYPWDNPENIITKELADDITFSMGCIVFPVITVLGLTGNSLTIMVFIRKQMRSTTVLCLTALAVSDGLFLVTNFMRELPCLIKQFSVYRAYVYDALSFMPAYYTRTGFSRVSTLLTVLVSIERLVAVYFPFKAKTILTSRKIFAAIVALYAFPFILLIPFMLCYTTGYIYDQSLQAERPYITATEFYRANKEIMDIYSTYVLMTVLRLFPTLIVFIINSCLVVKLAKARKMRVSMTGIQKLSEEQTRTTTMLLVVALVFLLCLSPGNVLMIASWILPDFDYNQKYHNLFIILGDVSLVLEMINSSINFVIYVFWNTKFLRVFQKIVCRKSYMPRSRVYVTASPQISDI